MEEFVNNIIEWIRANPHWAGIAVFAIAFLESLAIVGLAMPGWLLLVGVGSLIGSGSLSFWPIAFFSFAGAASGQALSFLVGVAFKERVHHWPWVENHQKLLHRAESFFRRHGFAGILIGQFIGPIRAVISLIAGILDMPAKKFLVAVLIASMIWAPVYLMPGVVLGAALTFEKNQIFILLSCLVTMAVCLWLLGGYLRQLWARRRAHRTDRSYEMTRHFALKMISTMSVMTAVILFLVVSSYGSLMLELSQKILVVIGE
ncbi:DedA family protein [Kangiella sediminilitoris]|uniref:SNARE associated Golgi protein n=1 Tax=Kangiella sediminilitoris TaxID=1144748 RepID=A0A1B3BD72_9GAMM|nr:DedA family protein [Kangiella sediminilitoris]AOE50769.1 SNARE associated Golgi protein [Kangiella sediminilitoris]